MLIAYRYNQGWHPRQLTTHGLVTAEQFFSGTIFTDSCRYWRVDTLGM